jgi:hypothetical protein
VSLSCGPFFGAGTSARAWSFLNLPEHRYFRRPLGGRPVGSKLRHSTGSFAETTPVAGDREEWDDHQKKAN